MPIYNITVTGDYKDGTSSSRDYSVDAQTADQASQLAAALFGRDEFDAGKAAPIAVRVTVN